ncbi:MAG: hypothetical protein U0R69_12395 [Gaiellales bacterium]
MDGRRRRELLGQWGPVETDPRERARASALQAEIEGAPAAGRRVEIRRRHFRPTVDSYVASLGGPLPYMVRLREIDRLTREAERALGERWHRLASECADDPSRFPARWRELVERWSFVEVNDLVDRHNRWYPIEARLAMDVKRRDYVFVNGKPYRQEPLDAAWALRRFPPDLAAADSGQASLG